MNQDARYDEEAATRHRAGVLRLDYINTSEIDPKPLYRELLSNQELYKLKVVPISLIEHNLVFGITTTTSQQTLHDLEQRFADYKVGFAIISDTGYRDYMKLYDPPKQVVYQDISVNEKSKEQIDKISDLLNQVNAKDMLGYLVSQAHKLNASDIHTETQPKDIRIRLRIDGVLHPIAVLSLEKYRILLSAIASAGNISTASDEAQQGHISQHITMEDGNEVDVNVRLETVPTINGTDVVMRLFNMDIEMYTLDKLDLSEKDRAAVDDIIAKPSGLVMVVGPTGSGKTTTLYSMMSTLNSDERKIITIEDPVEFQFPGITQISVHSSEGGNDDSFADKLRAILRLDPDIVMVGEIRDMDTARTALQAALTGHLVLATFHAGSTSASLTRIADIIGQNPLFISAIRLIMAQRLVRKLDDKTKQEYAPSASEMQIIHEIVNTFPENYPKPNLDNIKLYKPGTSEENPYGYEGQIAIREQFTMGDNVRSLLEGSDRKITATTIETEAVKNGMLTLKQYGLLKVLAGLTSFEELFRVIE